MSPVKLDKRIKNKGDSIFYRYQKKNAHIPVLVFIHGWVMNHTAMERSRIFLEKKGFSTLTFDIRGHGISVAENVSFKLVVEDMDMILARENIDDALLIGYSMGGMIAQEYIARHPKQVCGIVLINTTYKNPVKNLPFANPMLMSYMTKNIFSVIRDNKKREYFIKSMIRILSNNNKLFHEAYKKSLRYKYPRFNPKLDNTFIDFSKIEGLSDVAVFYEGLSRTNFNTANRFYIEKLRFDAKKYLSKIKVPALIIASRKDSFFPLNISRAMNRKIPGSELFILKNSDHLSIMQENLRINKRIYAFLKRHFTDHKNHSL